MKTVVINLLGGAGSGKSTTAAGLFYHFKMNNINCELIGEYVKRWAWEKREIKPLDQIYITGKQIKYESIVYNKVDYVITDSPIILGAIYDEFNNNSTMIKPMLDSFFETIIKKDIHHIYYFIKRNNKYDPIGRYGDENSAKQFDDFLFNKMIEWNIPFKIIDEQKENIVNTILNDLNINLK